MKKNKCKPKRIIQLLLYKFMDKIDMKEIFLISLKIEIIRLKM